MNSLVCRGLRPMGTAAWAALLLWAIGAMNIPMAAATENEDEEAARALFERNLAAIEDQDAEAYLACYLPSEALVRNGFDGVKLGYDSLAATMGEDTWPNLFEARDLQVHSVAPGVVYGQYHYHVRFGEVESRGVSERVFVKTEEGWRIAVTTAFNAPAALRSKNPGEEE